MRERAILATPMSFTITDPSRPDNPLVWVNPAFTETTGYSFDDAVGRNCRFLQGPDTDRQVIEKVGQSLRAARPVTTALLNYRKDGSTFWNEVSISPVHDSAGALTHFVGVQSDVTARVQAQRARDDAVSKVALAADRLALLADFTARMAMSQQPHQIIQQLGSVLTPRLGSWCAIYTFDESGRLTRPYLRHERQDTDPSIKERMERFREVVPEQLPERGPIWRVLRGDERQVLVTDYDAGPPDFTGSADDDRTSLLHELGLRSIIVVPLLARGGILGCVAVVTDADRAELGPSDLALAHDLAVRAGLMLENTQLYARERAVAASLQRSLLPRLPQISGIEIAASYVPAADEAAVGGDWYDVFALRCDDGVGVAVGDVMGHNYESAAQMGKLSTIVRAYAWPGSDPHTVLTAVDELLDGSGMHFLATCLYAKLTLHAEGATLRYSSAGHPPAIVRRPDGEAGTLDGGRGTMIGVWRLMPSGSQRPADATVELPSGSTLICFTDGLTDSFTAEPDMDVGLAELCRLTTALRPHASSRAIVDALTAAALRHTDDVAVVAIRIL